MDNSDSDSIIHGDMGGNTALVANSLARTQFWKDLSVELGTLSCIDALGVHKGRPALRDSWSRREVTSSDRDL